MPDCRTVAIARFARIRRQPNFCKFSDASFTVDLHFTAVLLFLPLVLFPIAAFAASNLRVGGAAEDITPLQYPVIVNGMFEERTADHDIDPLYARAFVFDDGAQRIGIVVVDSCMLPRELIDAAKAQAAKFTGIPPDRILISATHTHSAPASMGCLGSRPDPNYPAFLIPRLARVLAKANERVQPARIGFAKTRAPDYTFCRTYIRRPDRINKDPFGELTVRANMHPGWLSPDVIGPSGPVDDELSVLAMQTREGKPLGVLANFSMHYVDSPLLSSDYFGRFAEHLGKRLDGSDGVSSCIVSMSQGTSGDLASMNYSEPKALRKYDPFADDLAAMAEKLYRDMKFDGNVRIAIRERKLTLGRRVADPRRLAWARSMRQKIGDRRPKGWPEIYALEQLFLADEPQRELKLQAVRIGDVAIAAIPNEVYAITGLKLKLQSPFPKTFTIELANGAEGYIPPPEQHKLGGYTTWAARTAGLEVEAEPKIVAAELKLLEDVTGKPRRPIHDLGGTYAAAVLKSKPAGYWRLHELAGNIALDSSGNQLDAAYEGNIAHYLPGPTGTGFADAAQSSRATHLAGGSLHATTSNLGNHYTAEFWFWNGLPNDVRSITAYLFCRTVSSDENSPGDCLVITGKQGQPGRLQFTGAGAQNESLTGALHGHTTIEPRTWNHIALVRNGSEVWLYLNGNQTPELTGRTATGVERAAADVYFGARTSDPNTLEGKITECAVYDRPLSPAEIAVHYRAADAPKHNP